RGVPKTTESTKGLALLDQTLGPGALSPNQVVVDTGHRGEAWSPATMAAERRLVAGLGSDREVDRGTIQAPALIAQRVGGVTPRAIALARVANLVDPSGRYVQIRVAGRSDSGTDAARHLVERIRDRHIPQAAFPSET